VFQSVWTRKKIEKYDSKKLLGSEGSNPNRTHGSGSVQVRKFVGGSGSGSDKRGSEPD
jgi:hypothetical protein